MDVRLPDGTVISNVPEGTTKAQLVEKLSAKGHDVSWYTQETAVPPAPTIAESPRVRGYMEQLGRDTGRTARAAIEGIASIPQMLIGAPMEAAGVKGAGGNFGTYIADAFGIPKPETDTERFQSAVSGGIATAFPVLKAGQAMAAAPAFARDAAGNLSKIVQPTTRQMVGNVMASQPAAQLALSGVSGGASEAAKIGGLGPVGQLAAGVVAPMAAIPLAGLAVGGAKTVANIVSPIMGEKAAERGAARLATRVLGDRSENAAKSLAEAADDVTAGQVAAAIDNSDLAALQKIASQRDETLADLIKRSTEQRLKNTQVKLEESLAPIRNEALARADRGGVRGEGLIARATAFASQTGNQSNKVLSKSVREFNSTLRRVMDEDTGVVSPLELRTIREDLKSMIEKHANKNKDWNTKKTGAIERQLQLAIDDAIESAITRADPSKSGLWSSQYMKPYAEGMAGIRKVKTGLEREIDLAAKGTPAVSKMISDTEYKQMPNFLNKVATLVNFGIRAAEGSAGKAVERKLQQMMAPSDLGGNKKRLAELMLKEVQKPDDMLKSMFFRPGLNREQLGYGVDPAVPPAPTSNLPVPYVNEGQFFGKLQPDEVPNWSAGRATVPNPEVQVVPPRSEGLLGFTPNAEMQRPRGFPNANMWAERAAQEAEAAAPRKPASGGILYDLDQTTGKLRSVDQGLKGATPSVVESTGNNLSSAVDKISSGQRFALSAEERIAWDKSKVDLGKAAPELRGLSDDAIASRVADRQWVSNRIKELKTEYADWAKSTAQRFNAEQAAKRNELANTKSIMSDAERAALKAAKSEASRRMQVMLDTRKADMQASIDTLEAMTDTMAKPRAGSQIFTGFGSKTKAAKSGMLYGEQ